MQRFALAVLIAVGLGSLLAESAEAQLFGQGSGYGPVYRSGGGGLPTRDTYGRSTRTRRTTRTPRTNTGSNWTNRGYQVPRRTVYRPVRRKTITRYTTTFTYSDAWRVVRSLQRSGYTVYAPRARVIRYRPYAKTVYDIYYLR